MDSKIETIIGLSEQKIISLAEIIRFGTYDRIISFFKDKIFRVFSRDSIEDKFNKYFGRLGLDIPNIFDMSIFKIEVQEKYRGWKLDKLTNVFKERHDIVHNEKLPLNSLADLEIRKEFFDKLTLNMGKEINIKFGIPIDLPLAQPKKRSTD